MYVLICVEKSLNNSRPNQIFIMLPNNLWRVNVYLAPPTGQHADKHEKYHNIQNCIFPLFLFLYGKSWTVCFTAVSPPFVPSLLTVSLSPSALNCHFYNKSFSLFFPLPHCWKLSVIYSGLSCGSVFPKTRRWSTPS